MIQKFRILTFIFVNEHTIGAVIVFEVDSSHRTRRGCDKNRPQNNVNIFEFFH